MPRRAGQGPGNVVVAPKGEVAAPPKPKQTGPKPQLQPFQHGNGKAPVALDAKPARTQPQQQRSVYDVVPQRPETLNAALAKLDVLPGVDVQRLGDVDGIPVSVVRLKGAPPPPGVEPKRVLITGGVHGSEPAGAITAVELMQLITEHPENFAGYEFTVVPLVNPEGFRDDTRQNENDHADLNREVARDGSVPHEIELVLPVLDEGPWSLSLDLHASGSTTAAGKNGFFAIRTAGNDALLHDVLADFSKTHPVLDETTQRYTMVEPGVMESKNQGTVKGYLYEHGTTAAFTLEAPALATMKEQVDGLLDFALGFLKRHQTDSVT